MQHIGIDCRLAGERHAGIGRYTQNLVRRLPALAPDLRWTFFFTDQAQADQVLGENGISSAVKVVLAPVRHYSLAEQWQLPSVFQNQKLDLLHVPHFNVPLRYQGRYILTIHDLLWHEYRGFGVTTLPPWLYSVKYLSYRYVVANAVQRANAIVVPAETIQHTLLRFYPKLKGKVFVTKEGVDTAFLQPVKTKGSPTARKKVLLYIGSLYPHKNVRVILAALAELPGYELWLAGTRTVFQDKIRKAVADQKLEERVKFLDYVDDDKLREMCQEVAALVQPSFSEGFGLTGVEAMAAGAPVIASDIPIFREIYQDGASYFDPHSPQAFVQAVHDLEKLTPAAYQTRLTAAYRQAEQYSWDTMAAETLKVYRTVLPGATP